MGELRFGTAGIPLCAKKRNSIEAMKEVRQLGLEAMELEFVHSVSISEELAPQVKAAASENDITLTCHGPYYINLNAKEPAKYEAGKQWLIKAAHIASLCGAQGIAFHPAYYLTSSKEEAYAKVKAALSEVVHKLRQMGDSSIIVRPELTGKHTQFGTVEELLALSSELEGVMPCIDYAHLRARDGKNSKDDFARLLERIEQVLGRAALKQMHIQCAGVEFTEKGERRHLLLAQSDLNYPAMVETWRDFSIEGVVISESPNIEGDALLLKKQYREASHGQKR